MAKQAAARQGRLGPDRSLVIITREGLGEVTVAHLDPCSIGEKAFGLLCVPQAWTLPFFVVTSSAVRDLSDAELSFHLASAARKSGLLETRVMVRSNGVVEGLAQRGAFESEACPWQETVSMLRTLNEKAQPNSEEDTHWLVQNELEVRRKGHLSNERRLRYEKRDWVIETEESEKCGAGEAIPIAVRKWRDGDLANISRIECDSALKVSLGLRRVALWAGQDSRRFLFEWVWDGNVLYIVQMDPADVSGGDNPLQLLPSSIPSIAVGPLRSFREASAEDKSTLKKLANACLYEALGYRMPPFYVLELTRSTLELLRTGSVPSPLWDDLQMLTSRPLVLRTDGTAIPPGKREMLPRSEELRTPEAAAAWLRDKFCPTITELGIEEASLVLVAHHFIPSVASAWAGAEPGRRWVRIEALWGIPESLYWYSHDTFEVDTERADLRLPFAHGADYPIRQKNRFKGTFIAPDQEGRWVRHRTKAPADWSPTISSKEWLREIAHTTKRICKEAGKPVEVMWFVDNHSAATPHRVLPWYHSTPESSQKPVAAPRKKIKSSQERSVRDSLDWHGLRQALATGALIERVTVEPHDPELVRNQTFAKELGTLAKNNGFVIVLAGGILSHAYHALQEAGASVECLDLFGTSEEKAEYNKLVRDKVPSQIADRGEYYDVARLSGEALIVALRRKLIEEAIEVLDAGSGAELLGELADVVEVVRSLAKAIQVDPQQLEDERARKQRKRGGFDDGYMLLATASPHTIPRVEAAGSLVTIPTFDEPRTISNPEQLPQKAVYKRPDHRTLSDSTEELLVVETELNRLGTITESVGFELPTEVEPHLYTSSIELSRVGADLRAVVRLHSKRQTKPSGEQLSLQLELPNH